MTEPETGFDRSQTPGNFLHSLLSKSSAKPELSVAITSCITDLQARAIVAPGQIATLG
jgi:hypothetical protein